MKYFTFRIWDAPVTSQNLVAKSMEKLVKANDIKFVCGLGDNIMNMV